MSLRCAVLFALSFVFLLVLNCGSVKLTKSLYNAEISCNASKKFDCKLNGTADRFCIDLRYTCNGNADCPSGSQADDEEDKLCSKWLKLSSFLFKSERRFFIATAL